jgi:hypothetical protein
LKTIKRGQVKLPPFFVDEMDAGVAVMLTGTALNHVAMSASEFLF